MNSISINVGMDPDELRNAAGVLTGIANVVEANMQAKGVSATVDNDIDVKTYDVDGRQYTADQIRNGGWDREQLALVGLNGEDILEIFGPAETDGTTAAAAFGGDDDENKTEGVELDADNIPWDARIHAPSKLKLKREKTWKLKKSIDPVLVETVKKELRETMAAPAATEATNTSNIADAKPKAPAGPASPKGPAKPAAPETPVAEIKYVTADGEWTRAQLLDAGYDEAGVDALPVAEQAAAPEATTDVTFPELMQLVTPALAAGTITDEQVTTACVKQGVASIALIAARPDLIPAVKTELFG